MTGAEETAGAEEIGAQLKKKKKRETSSSPRQKNVSGPNESTHSQLGGVGCAGSPERPGTG